MGIDSVCCAQPLAACQNELPLGDWYADPLAHTGARAVRQQAHQALQQAYTHGTDSFHARLMTFIADYWLGRSGATTHRTLVLTASSDPQRALADLVFGQLLMSCKCSGAYEWLESGFAKAANLFRADEYFRVLKRHTLLRALVLADRPSMPQNLASLLEEARVISRLTACNGRSSHAAWSSEDTVG